MRRKKVRKRSKGEKVEVKAEIERWRQRIKTENRQYIERQW